MATFGAFCGPARRRRAQGGLWIAISHHVNKRGGWYMGNEKCQHSCVDRQWTWLQWNFSLSGNWLRKPAGRLRGPRFLWRTLPSDMDR